MVAGGVVVQDHNLPLTSGHLSCRDTFAWSQGCPFITGTTVFNKEVKNRQSHNEHTGIGLNLYWVIPRQITQGPT